MNVIYKRSDLITVYTLNANHRIFTVNFIAMNFYTIIKQLHSGFRYIVFILILIAIIQSLLGWFGKKNYTEGNRKLNLFALISAHTQLLIGIVLLFVSPYVKFSGDSMKDDTLRYFTAEH